MKIFAGMAIARFSTAQIHGKLRNFIKDFIKNFKEKPYQIRYTKELLYLIENGHMPDFKSFLSSLNSSINPDQSQLRTLINRSLDFLNNKYGDLNRSGRKLYLYTLLLRVKKRVKPTRSNHKEKQNGGSSITGRKITSMGNEQASMTMENFGDSVDCVAEQIHDAAVQIHSTLIFDQLFL